MTSIEDWLLRWVVGHAVRMVTDVYESFGSMDGPRHYYMAVRIVHFLRLDKMMSFPWMCCNNDENHVPIIIMVIIIVIIIITLCFNNILHFSLFFLICITNFTINIVLSKFHFSYMVQIKSSFQSNFVSLLWMLHWCYFF